MKKYIFALIAIAFVAACRPSSDAVPTSIPIRESKFKKLEERIDITSGFISIYTYGNDTLYVVEGSSSSYPVGITIK